MQQIYYIITNCLTLSWRRPLSHRNQYIDLRSESMDWFLYDNGLRHERVKMIFVNFFCLISLKKLNETTSLWGYFYNQSVRHNSLKKILFMFGFKESTYSETFLQFPNKTTRRQVQIRFYGNNNPKMFRKKSWSKILSKIH